jgi:hypothetical protein
MGVVWGVSLSDEVAQAREAAVKPDPRGARPRNKRQERAAARVGTGH